MKTRLAILLAASMLLSTALPGLARAGCVLSGYAVKVVQDKGKTFLYFRPSPTANYYYLGNTSDHRLSNAIYQAYRGKTKILVSTKAKTCPTIAGQGEHEVGKINSIGLGF